MLKINLLPSYIYEKRSVRRAIFMFSVLFVACAVGMIFWWIMLRNTERNLNVRVTDMEAKAGQVATLQQQVDAATAKIPPYEAKVKFIEDLQAYNVKVPKLYEDLAKYTYAKILYKSVQPAGTTLTIQAHANSIGDCGRYLLNMYRAQHLFTSVSINEGAIPGWPAQGGSATSAAGPGMMPGGPGAMPGMGRPSLAMGPRPSGAGMPGMPGMPGMGAMPGMGGRSQVQAAASNTGIDFTVTCTLRDPITPPTYSQGTVEPDNATAMPGMPPGMPGMPGRPTGPGMPGAGGASATPKGRM